VADVDQLDPLRPTAVVDREQVTAREGEQTVDPVGLQPPRDQAAAVQQGVGLGRDGGRLLDRRRSIEAMSDLHTPSEEHQQFDQICSKLTEWDTLPSVRTPLPEHEPEGRPEEGDAALDGLILAGLVAPY
jgi:hypothetical protein